MTSPMLTPVFVEGVLLERLFARAGDRARACRAVLALLVARYDGTREAVVLGATPVHARFDDAPDAVALFTRLEPTSNSPTGLRAALGPYDDSDIELHLGDGLHVVVHAERLVARWVAGQIARLCESLADGTGPVLALPILGAAEEARVLACSGVAAVRLDEIHPTVVARFEAHVGVRSDATAVVDGPRTLTYAELDCAAERLAARLVSAITPSVEGAIVAVYIERSADAVIAFLGILKACATYVPIDTAYPAGRVSAILNVAAPSVVITRRALAGQLPEGTVTLLIDDVGEDVALVSLRVSPPRAHRAPTVEDNAYAIFTSGSTGRPKGVLVDHRTLANYTRAVEDAYGFAADDRVLQGASLGFDLSLEEIVVTLTTGAALVIRSAPQIDSVQSFLDECIARGISILSITSALWHELTLHLEDGSVRLPPRLRLVILGADAARPDVLEVWQRVTGGAVRLVNSYGLTETTIVATTWEAKPEPLGPGWRALPVGKPLRNTSAYVLDAHDQLVPFGVPGEICIGGLAVARRYLGDDALTRSRFVADPYLPGQRMYRTGDRGVLRPDGELEFLGRSDYQMKVNGVRIELGEIESRIREIPGVTEGIVVARKNAGDETELQAYVMVAGDLRSTTIREYLLRVLPRPTVPALILVVERFPLTAAGKIDRRALAELAKKDRRQVSWVPPTNALEEIVLAVAAEVLRVAKPSMLDGFVALGGTSLSAVRAASILGRRLERPVRARYLLQGATFQETCTAITDGEHEPALEKDRILDPAIQPLQGALSSTRAPLARVLLTGGTGFYGTFVLAELIARTSAHVVCLVRAADVTAGLGRIADSLARFECAVDPEVLAARVTVVVGDLAEPDLGLTPDAFAALADDVDSIFHVGAAVNLLLPYASLRAANVRAVGDILRLATTCKPKSVHHVSTVEVLTDMDPGAPEAWLERPAAATPVLLHEGYGQSKWVAEKLVEEARARGIRAFIHRPGRLMGHATTGAFNPEDFLVRMLEACGQIGAAPDLGVDVDITPVDYAARALVHLAGLEPLEDAAFHFVNRDVLSWNAFVGRIVAVGYPLRTVSHAEWCGLLADGARSAPASAEFLRYLAGMTRAETENGVHGGPVGTRTEARLDFTCPPVDDALVATYLSRLVDAGRFVLPAAWSAAAE